MSSITIIGAGNMGTAIAGLALAAGSEVQVLTREATDLDPRVAAGTVGDELKGDVVVLALPYGAVAEVVDLYADRLDGKVVVDITNPLDFATFDALVVPDGSSAAAQIQQRVPGARVLKAFNTNFAATLASGQVGPLPTTVLVAGDDADAKAALAGAVSGVRVVDAGSLKRAHELEALGFLQLTLAAGEKTSWTTGFALAE
ncbi:NADPH-dependent F420 reductase [Cellulosimicrobium cellulans]|uniref:NADPH-dependent F420 reductase n=1 Tax=Cellulosimicrobium cellulans TaxID=1710 RepID=UPI001EDADC4D|nr:NAD(P)-binding domain-containing protein [Cellulosimicrobium cellulans]MDF9877585.1 putative dinucleotide-binding enzyme [Cellulosimicrobium cellulans]UKJ62290.1 NAD(P)-binding domain-containing protein [Cellulosimicrobium cellulans]